MARRVKNKRKGPAVILEKTYYEDVWLKDPDTGKKVLHKNVKIDRYKTLAQAKQERADGVLGDDLLARIEAAEKAETEAEAYGIMYQ